MIKATNKADVIYMMKKHDFYLKKDLGQNFLIDENVVSNIVDSLEIEENDIVVEVGPGMGSLTQKLCEKAKKVYGVEIDTRAVLMLEETLEGFDNVEIINKDILKVDLEEFLSPHIENGENIKFISNLPYYITSPIIMKILQSKLPFKNIVVMLQKEVASRIYGKVNTKDYSVFTIIIDYYAEVEKLFDVSKNVFIPPPKVDSTVIKIKKRETEKVEVLREEMFFKVIKASFMNRRKMAFNSIVNALRIDKEKVKTALHNSGIDEKARAENITIEEFALLSNEINKIMK